MAIGALGTLLLLFAESATLVAVLEGDVTVSCIARFLESEKMEQKAVEIS